MQLLPFYKRIAVTLTVVFALYIIGLPVLITACPMMASGEGMKGLCCKGQPVKGVTISQYKNYSCCKVTVAAKPSTTEFMLSKQKIEQTAQAFLLPQVALLNTVNIAVVPFPVSASPPPLSVRDIPIAISSLLI